MKDYIKAKEDIEKINQKSYSERGKQIFFSVWFVGFLFTTVVFVKLISIFLEKRLDIIYLGPIKIVLIVLISIFTLGVFFIIPTIPPIYLRYRTFKEMNKIVKDYRYSLKKDNEKLYNDLLNMKNKPRGLYETVLYYSHIASVLIYKGEIMEGIKILDLLDENPYSKKTEEYIGKLRKHFRDDLRVNLIVALDEIASLKLLHK